MRELDRRQVLGGLAAGALITAFDPAGRRWLTGGAAGAPAGSAVIPPLTGTLLTDAADRAADADDFGHIVHRTPQAVLRPGSVGDIVAMVRFCRDHRIPVAARGQGHATFGQAQVDGGLVIEMSTLNAISVTGSQAVVQAGARWSAVLGATLPLGLTPPVLADYLEISVGGTLSVGGVGGSSHHFGAQVDNVAELEVVTGAGDHVVCSPSRRPALFEAVLAGLGQCAIVVRATINLTPATGSVRHYILYYPTLPAMTADQRLLAADGRFSFLEGEIAMPPAGTPGWQYYIEACAYFDTVQPDDATLLSGLSYTQGTEQISDSYTQGTEQISDMAYFDFLNRLAPAVSYLEATGEWYDPHPWFNVFLPSSVTDGFVGSVMSALTTADIGASGVILLYPLRRAKFGQPLLRVPDEDTFFLFAILRTAAPDFGANTAAAMVTANGTLFQQVRGLNGYQYPVGSIPMSFAGWRSQFGLAWPFLAASRAIHDPAGILAPGQGIFPAPPPPPPGIL